MKFAKKISAFLLLLSLFPLISCVTINGVDSSTQSNSLETSGLQSEGGFESEDGNSLDGQNSTEQDSFFTKDSASEQIPDEESATEKEPNDSSSKGENSSSLGEGTVDGDNVNLPDVTLP